MKVYLLKDVENLGRKGEIKEVKDGFALNYLIPKKLAIIADKNLIRQIERRHQEKEVKEALEIKEKEKIKSEIESLKLEIPLKFLKESGQSYDSVNKKRIVEELKKYNLNILEKQILLEKPLKKEGEYQIKINLGHHLIAILNIKIVPLKE